MCNTPLVLLGYMGCGKSTVGRSLAAALSWDFVDLDDYISNLEGCTIADIFEKHGEIRFREMESNHLKNLLTKQNTVISLGGGTPCYGNNMDMIGLRAKSIYLKASPKTLFQRLKKEQLSRPLIAHIPEEKLPDFIKKHLFERTPYYVQADHTLVVDNISISNAVEQLLVFVSKL